ncbi:MAG TPA: hypothetical protein VKK79_16835 [Candidatus Lokiarchaeia archaeon]|nr:hypothetical protein [Candidatus Lokiarchaeia archaeon]
MVIPLQPSRRHILSNLKLFYSTNPFGVYAEIFCQCGPAELLAWVDYV